MLFSLFLGCSLRHCGEAEIHTGYEGYDWDDGYDQCGAMLGLTGDEDVSGAGWLNATPLHREWEATTDLYMSVYLDVSSIQPGQEVVFVPEIPGTWARSDAYLMDADTSHVAVADLNLEESFIEVSDLVAEDDCSEPFASRTWSMRWSLLFRGRGVEPWYSSSGEDEVSLFRADCGV